MLRSLVLIAAGFVMAGRAAATSLIPQVEIPSADGRLVAVVTVQGEASYSVRFNGKPILQRSRLGVVRDDADFSVGLAITPNYSKHVATLEKVEDRYELLTSKRRHNTYRANRRVIEVQAANGARMDIEFQVSNDGVAFRYVFPENQGQKRRITREATSFNFTADTRTFLQPVAPARSGWSESNPSYEELYERDQPLGKPSDMGGGYVFPALFKSGDTWLLVSEAGLDRNYCGSRLLPQRRSSEYTLQFPGPLETSGGGAVTPEATLPWKTPWRFVAIGSLGTIVESTLGTDLADAPPPGAALLANGPGKASWSWPLLKDENTVFDVQKQFVDYAARMKWQYTLVDAEWDVRIGYEKLRELVEYGKSKGVRILVWYNSAGEWNVTPQTPRDRMFKREVRRAEFKRLQEMGVAGAKVDFFAGDAQSTIAYYHDLLADAAEFGLLMNFHGATLPRGWQRTYPNLMTMESVRGLEFLTFDQKAAEDEPWHAAMLPFTRNVFDPMDFTPVVLDRIPRIERRTSSAFELALSVLFTSGIQHFAEIPAGMAKAPPYVQDFLRDLPAIWDDVKFIDGYPGSYAVIARRVDRKWYVAGINGDTQPRKVELDLKKLGGSGRGTLITDGGGALGFKRETFPLEGSANPTQIEMRGRGGFVLSLD